MVTMKKEKGIVLYVPEESKWGPAMLDLTEKQQKFVISLLESGGTNFTRAALEAGYGGGDRESAKARAWELANNPKVILALKEMSRGVLDTNVLGVIMSVAEVAKDKTHKRHLEAAKMIMPLVGFGVVTEHKVAVTHRNESRSELEEQIKELARRTGQDVSKLLGVSVVDAEYEEVKPEAKEDAFDENESNGAW